MVCFLTQGSVMVGFNKSQVGIIIYLFKITIAKCLNNLLQCKMALTEFKSLHLGMETLLNAPLHASQQRDKVSEVTLLFYHLYDSYHYQNRLIAQ